MARDRRVCICDNESVQDEKHVLLHCTLSANLRLEFGMLSFNSMSNFLGSDDIYSLCKYIHKLLRIYY